MCSLLRLIQFILRPARNYLFLMLQIMVQHLQQIHDLRLVIDKSEHDHAEGILELCMFIQLVQDHVCVHISPQFDDNTHPLAAGLVA